MNIIYVLTSDFLQVNRNIISLSKYLPFMPLFSEELAFEESLTSIFLVQLHPSN